MIVNNELGGMWKEPVQVYFKILSICLPGGPQKKDNQPLALELDTS